MAEVYEVENERSGARFALKVFTLNHGDVDLLKRRFLVEGRLLARLVHPRIVRVYDMDVDGESGLAYYVMDLVLDPSGCPRSLRDALENGEVTEEKVANWYEDLREGLSYIHGAGVVHRDITLENVLIGADGRVVLSDFGVSKILPHDLRAELQATVSTMVCGERPLMGKPFYLAPELAKGAEESAASDWYSLGVMMLRLLTQVWYMPGAHLADMLMPFDPQWRVVLPSLLADDPAARICPPWHQARSARAVVTAENRTNEVTLRIRFPHWLLGGIMLALCLACLMFALLAVYEHGQRRSVERELEQVRHQLQGVK